MIIGNKDKILVTNIQRFSIHDGPGIRTTVFLKGCSLKCPWCSNPENIKPTVQKFSKSGVEGIYGEYISAEELYLEILKDYPFYRQGQMLEKCKQIDYSINSYDEWNKLPGGVTFSGGEALLQIRQLKPLLQMLKEKNIHITVETSLFVDEAKVELALKYIDLFYVDMKIVDSEKCKNVLHGNFELYERNLQKLLLAERPVIMRIPVIAGYTDDSLNRDHILSKLNRLHNISDFLIKVELIKGHRLGTSKYESLGMDIPCFEDVSDDLLNSYMEAIRSIGIEVEICKI